MMSLHNTHQIQWEKKENKQNYWNERKRTAQRKVAEMKNIFQNASSDKHSQ